MDFEFSDAQLQVQDALRRYFAKEYDFDTRQKIVVSQAGADPAQWAKLVELGVTAWPVPEASGGFDGGVVDMLVVMQEVGRALVVEPCWSNAVGTEALRLANTEQANALLGSIVAGRARVAVAFNEPGSRYDLLAIKAVAREDSDGFRLTGTKSVVQHGAQADAWIVPATCDIGIALFLVAKSSEPDGVTDYRTIDGQRAATISLDGCEALLLVSGSQGAETLEQIADYGAILLCAEALGAMDSLVEATTRFVKERQQFGGPIARFQALQHALADMLIHLEQARSLTYLAAGHYSNLVPDERRRTTSAAKARIGMAARFIGQHAIQLHGGMGLSNELAVGHWFKRLSMIETTLGDVDYHLERFGRSAAFRPSELTASR